MYLFQYFSFQFLTETIQDQGKNDLRTPNLDEPEPKKKLI